MGNIGAVRGGRGSRPGGRRESSRLSQGTRESGRDQEEEEEEEEMMTEEETRRVMMLTEPPRPWLHPHYNM